MFEDRSYENILREVLAQAPKGVDIRQGSIYYDAVAGVCFKLADYYADISTMFDLVFLSTAVDEYLDLKGQEFGVYRNRATKAVYEYVFAGSPPLAGERFYANNKYFRLYRKEGAYLLEAEEAGTSPNSILEGTSAMPVNNIGGLTLSEFGELIDPGVDTETDDDYRQRIRDKVAGPAENGNCQHYKTWCEQMQGVGRARIIPLWDGENTVKGVIISSEGTPAAKAVVDRVQEYIDPEGTGLGNGVANIGARFTAVSAEALTVNVAFSADVASGATVEQVEAEARAEITEHLRNIALNTSDSEAVIVRVSTIGALLYALPSIVDYSDLTLNGSDSNIEMDSESVAVLGEVDISEIV